MGCLWEIISAPFRFVIWLIGAILELTGRFMGFMIGLVVCALGVAVSLTVVGAIIGVPMVIIGGGLMLKCLF